MSLSIPNLLFLLVIGLWLTGLTVVYFRRLRLLEQITERGKTKDLGEILTQLDKRIKISDNQIRELSKRYQDLEDSGRRHIQKIGFIRFNPFADTGGEQSFVLSLLDAANSGVVITVLHARGGTRWYTKMVKKGVAQDLELSREEKQAIKQARLC